MVGAGPAQADGIEFARRCGCFVVALDRDADAPGLASADVGLVTDVTDVEKAIEAAREHRVDAALSIASEVCLPTVARVNREVGLPGLSVEQVALATNKGAMRLRFEECGVPSIPFRVLLGEGDLEAAADEIGFPLVVKPADNAGSRGVRLVDRADALPDGYATAKSFSRSGQVVVESFLAGPEVSVEAFVTDGEIVILTLSDKDRTPPPCLLDTAVRFPSAYPPDLQAKVKLLAERAIRCLGLDNCPIHMELILGADGPRVVDLAARGPGFKVFTLMIPHVTGVNCVEAQVVAALGEGPRIRPNDPLRGACVRFFEGRNGRVSAVRGVDEGRAVPGVHELEIYCRPGDETRRLTCGDDRVGHVIVLGNDREAADRQAAAAYDKVAIEYE